MVVVSFEVFGVPPFELTLAVFLNTPLKLAFTLILTFRLWPAGIWVEPLLVQVTNCPTALQVKPPVLGPLTNCKPIGRLSVMVIVPVVEAVPPLATLKVYAKFVPTVATTGALLVIVRFDCGKSLIVVGTSFDGFGVVTGSPPPVT